MRCRDAAPVRSTDGRPDHHARVRRREAALLCRRHRAGVPRQAVLQPHHQVRHRPPSHRRAQQRRGRQLRRLPRGSRLRRLRHPAGNHQRSARRAGRHRDHRRPVDHPAAAEHDHQRPLRAVHLQGGQGDRGGEERRHRLRGGRHEHRHRPDAVRRHVRHQQRPAVPAARRGDLLGRRPGDPDHRRAGVPGDHPLRRAQEHRG